MVFGTELTGIVFKLLWEHFGTGEITIIFVGLNEVDNGGQGTGSWDLSTRDAFTISRQPL